MNEPPYRRPRPQGWTLPQRPLGWPLEQSTPDTLAEYWKGRARELRARFDRIRTGARDSSVRGNLNEHTVAEFMESVTQGSVVRNTSILDSSGLHSGEVDIAICNEDQPLLGGDSSSRLLIIEGVDVVIQVKAKLTTGEVPRIRDNCLSIKALHKARSSDDDHREDADAGVSTFLDQVPYFVFCFDTALSSKTATARLNEAHEDVHPAYRPDCVFVLGKYSLVNRIDYQSPHGELLEPLGFNLEATGELAIADFMYRVFTYPPRVRRRWHPLTAYWR